MPNSEPEGKFSIISVPQLASNCLAVVWSKSLLLGMGRDRKEDDEDGPDDDEVVMVSCER